MNWEWVVIIIFLSGGVIGGINTFFYNEEKHKSNIPKWTSSLNNGTYIDEFLRTFLPKLPWWVTKIVYALFTILLLTLGVIGLLIEFDYV